MVTHCYDNHTMITYNDIVAATPNVLKRLKQLATLPNHGTVAGQAVASLFYEELNIGVSGPINDIDIFVSLNLPPEQRGVVHTGALKGVRANRTSSNVTSMAAESNDYSQIKFICARSNVTIFRTYQDGLRNFTLIRHDEDGSDGEQTVDVSHDIIRGFDLNLVGVGIHLESGTPVATQDFIDFLNHKTMKIVTCNTPTHTLIRLAKKAHSGEFSGAKCNYDEQRSMVETHLELINRNDGVLINTGKVVLKVGEKYRSLANTYAQHLPPLKRDTRSGLYTFNPKSLRVEPAIDAVENLLKINGIANKKVDFLLSYIFVANFPRVYDMVNDPNPHRWDTLSHAWNANNEVNDGVRLDNVIRALFNTSLIDPQLGLEGVEAATFVFNNTLNAAQREHATHLYKNLAHSEKIILHNKFPHIKHIQKFADNKDAYVESFLRTDGFLGLLKISPNIPSHEVHDLMEKLCALIKKAPAHTMRLVDDIKTSQFITQSPNLFKNYEDKQGLFEKLLEMDGVNVDQLNEAEIYIFGLAYFNDLWQNAWENDTKLPYTIENFLYQAHWLFETSFENGWGEQPYHISFVNKAINNLHDSQLFKNQGALLLNILVPQHYDIIRQRLMKIDRATVLNEISEVSQHLCYEQESDKRTSALWSKLVLDLNTALLGASKSKRKM